MIREGRRGPRCLERVTGCFRGAMLRFARQRCKSPEVAEDTVQDALILALESLDGFRGEAAISTWLNQLVISACSRRLRGRKNDATLNLPLTALSEEGEVDRRELNQEARVLVAERGAHVHRLLDHIAEPDRSLLRLHDGEGVPIRDLAARFNLTTNAVKGRLKRARATARRWLHAELVPA
jgi:RNA polymerase sigma-70 factor, ECF subfamily